MYLKGWFLTWSKNNSLPNSSLDHISRYNQNNLNIMNANEMIVNTTNLRYMIVTKNEQCMKNQTNLFNKNQIYNPKNFLIKFPLLLSSVADSTLPGSSSTVFSLFSINSFHLIFFIILSFSVLTFFLIST